MKAREKHEARELRKAGHSVKEICTLLRVAKSSVSLWVRDGLSEDEIRSWWVEQLPQLRPDHLRGFVRCTANRASQRKKVGKRPYGTATIAVYNTDLFYNVLGGIQFLQDWAIGETVSRRAYTAESGVQLPHRPLRS